MRRRTISMLQLAVLSLLFSLGAMGQATFEIDWQLPMGFPGSDYDTKMFAAHDALVVAKRVRLFRVAGLTTPATATAQELLPPPPLAIGTYFRQLSENALYSIDPAGEVLLVRDLPSQPVFVATGVSGFGPDAHRVNDSTAIIVDSGGFRVLRHGEWGASLHLVSAPVALQVASPFRYGRCSDDCWVVVSAVNDRDLVVLEGLGGDPSGFSVSVSPLPPGPPLEGFFVTEGGIGVGFEYLTPADIGLHLLDASSGSPALTSHTVAAPAWASPQGPHEVKAARGRGIMCYWQEPNNRLSGALVMDLAGTPDVIHTWLDGSAQTARISVDEGELVELGAPAGSFHDLTWRRFEGGVSTTRTLTTPGQGLFLGDFLKPNRDTLVVHSPGNQLNQSWVTVFSDIDGAAVPHPVSVMSLWDAASLFPMTPGLIGTLASSFAPWPTLTVIGVPTASPVGIGATGYPLITLQTAGTLPRVGQPFSVQAWSPGYAGEALWVAGASALGEPLALGGPFHTHSRLELDPQAFLGLVPATPEAPGIWSLNLGLEAMPLSLAGTELYLQAVHRDLVGSFSLSNTMLVIPG